MLRGTAWCALAALLVATVAVPSAAGDHCQTKINVYGRTNPAPMAAPPYSMYTWSLCVRASVPGVLKEHTLPPNTDQLMVRVAGDFGPSIRSIDVEFDGLGFVDIHHALVRTSNAAGGYTYELPDWLGLPNGARDGDVTVTVTLPGGVQRSVTYSTSATLVPPTAPPS